MTGLGITDHSTFSETSVRILRVISSLYNNVSKLSFYKDIQLIGPKRKSYLFQKMHAQKRSQKLYRKSTVNKEEIL